MRANEKNDSASSSKRVSPHPLGQPYRCIDVTAPDGSTVSTKPICRFYNYATCNKGKDCRYLHTHCHICLQEGHLALQCPQYIDPEAFRQLPGQFHAQVKRTVLGHEIIGWEPPVHLRTSDELQLYRCKHHKKWEARRLLTLPTNATFVDVGAHYGDTVITMALCAYNEGRKDLKFVAVEPCANKCEWIRRVAQDNQLSSMIRVIQACVGDNDTQWVTPSGTHKQLIQGNMIYVKAVTEENQKLQQPIQMITLDSIRDLASPLGILHLDVEGWEAPALEGAELLLRQTCFATPRGSSAATKIDKNIHFSFRDDCAVRNQRCKLHRVPRCWIVAEILQKRLGASGLNPEKEIERIMQRHPYFVRQDDLVDRERNMVFCLFGTSSSV